MDKALEKELDVWAYPYLEARDTFSVLKMIELPPSGELVNAYADAAITTMLRGVILEVCIAAEELRVPRTPPSTTPCPACGRGPKTPAKGRFGKALLAHADTVTRNPWEGRSVNEEPTPLEAKEEFWAAYDRLFPDVAKRSATTPTRDDIADLSEQFSRVVEPLRNHRNTMIAHKRPKQVVVGLEAVDKCIAEVDRLVRDVEFVLSGGAVTGSSVGTFSDEEAFAAKMSALLLTP